MSERMSSSSDVGRNSEEAINEVGNAMIELLNMNLENGSKSSGFGNFNSVAPGSGLNLSSSNPRLSNRSNDRNSSRGVALKISQGGQTPKNVFQGGQTPKKPEKISKTLRISRLLPFFSIFRGGAGRAGLASFYAPGPFSQKHFFGSQSPLSVFR